MRMYGQVKGRRGKDIQPLYVAPKTRRCGCCHRFYDERQFGFKSNGKTYKLCPSCRQYFADRKAKERGAEE